MKVLKRFFTVTFALVSVSLFSQNSPFSVNSTSGQSLTILSSTIGWGSQLKFQRFNSSTNYYAFETGAGSNDDLRLHMNNNWSSPLVTYKTNGDVVMNGGVGIGTTPIDKLSLNGSFGFFGAGLDGSTYQRTVMYSDINYGLLIEAPKNAAGDKLDISLNWRGGGPTPFFIKGSNSCIGIGTTNPDAKLAVKGTVHANEVKVDLNVPGPDYVFEPTYTLPSLDAVQSYINQNKHLPEVPSAKEMEANGVKLGEMNMLLLKKVEELTLYMIELKEENEQQSKQNELQQRQIEALQKLIKQ